MIATDNVAGGLLDLAGRRAAGARDRPDPEVALAIEDRYKALWSELTAEVTMRVGERRPIRAPLRAPARARVRGRGDGGRHERRRLDAALRAESRRARLSRRTAGSLTGLVAGENQARRMLHDIKGLRCRAAAHRRRGRARERRRRAVARPAFRTDHGVDPARAVQPARGGRDLPPTARAPLVHGRAGRPRRHARGGARRLFAAARQRRPRSASSSISRTSPERCACTTLEIPIVEEGEPDHRRAGRAERAAGTV